MVVKVKKEEQSEKTEQFQTVYEMIKEMRIERNAPVDSMGCASSFDETLIKEEESSESTSEEKNVEKNLTNNENKKIMRLVNFI